MQLSNLNSDRTDAYLARLGAADVRLSAQGLTQLQAAHLKAVPFHNLILLANDGRPWGLQPLEQVVDEAIAGVGGNCDRTTPPFTSLLRAVGFDAQLAAATIREPGDHFVAVVKTEGRRFLCDVGNGHPYLQPWDLDGPVQEQSFHGWSFRFDPRGAGGPTLVRDLGPDGVRTIYVVDPTPKAYQDFAPMVVSHYTQAGFGPFLSGLRAVRIDTDAVLTLRDLEYARDTRFGRSVRSIVGRDAVTSLLTERFGLAPQLVHQAVDVMARRRPDLLGDEPRWFALGRGLVEDSAHIEPPPRVEVPDVLVSFATIGRAGAVRRLLATLADEVRESGYPGRVGVLVVENHEPQLAAVRDAPPGLTVHRVPVGELRGAVRRATRAGVLPALDTTLPLPIGAAREAQLAAIHAHLCAPRPGLPHPNERPMVVWMLDDDVAFQQLGEDGEARRRTNLLFRVARYWRSLPQHSAIIGTLTGDPPVPGLDSLSGQLHDLTANVLRMQHLGSTGRWVPSSAPAPVFDAYYDLSEARSPDADAVWPYGRHLGTLPTRGAALSLLRDLPRLLDGQQLTRAITWDGQDVIPKASLRRGGNALFLDLDTVFRWPTPVMGSADGVQTRRADTLWAALAHKDQQGAVVEATLPLLHGREGQADPAERTALRLSAAAHTAAQVRGVVLSRALAEGRSVRTELPAREARVASQRLELVARIRALRDAVLGLGSWRDDDIDAAVADGLEVLDQLRDSAADGGALPGDPDELLAFLAELPDAVDRWRCSYGAVAPAREAS